MFFSFVKRLCASSVILCLSALAFSGCAVISSANMLGDAVVLKYSTNQKKFRYVEAGTVTAGDESREVSSPHHSKSMIGLYFVERWWRSNGV